MIVDSLKTLREKNEGVMKSFNAEFLVSQAYEERQFREAIAEILEKFRINRSDKNSVILIGERTDSFKNLYEDISKVYLRPISERLPKDKEVSSIVKTIATGQQRLDN